MKPWNQLTLAEVCEELGQRDVVTVNHSTSVLDALNMMRSNNVHSLVVLGSPRSELLGIVNVVDLVGLLSAIVANAPEGASEADLIATAHSKLAVPVGDILGVSAESDTAWVYDADAPIEKGIEVLSKGVHRIVVQRRTGIPVAYILSQSDMVRFLAKRIKELAPWVNESITANGIGDFKKVVSVFSTDTAVKGFWTLFNHDLTAIAVVDPETGALVNTLSSADIRNVPPPLIPTLRQPISIFLAEVQHRPVAQVTGSINDNLAAFIEKLALGRIHRVWIVDEKGRPESVVSISDVLAVVYRRFL